MPTILDQIADIEAEVRVTYTCGQLAMSLFVPAVERYELKMVSRIFFVYLFRWPGLRGTRPRSVILEC